METTFEHSNELNTDIKSIAKRNGMKKEEWILWALTEMVRQVEVIEKKISDRTVEETKKLLEDRDTPAETETDRSDHGQWNHTKPQCKSSSWTINSDRYKDNSAT